MKKTHIVIVFLLFFVSNNLLAQLCPYDNQFYGQSFDWERNRTFTFYLLQNNGAPTSIDNPFFARGVTCNDNIKDFCNTSDANKDIAYADGWVFVTKDFGRPNSTIENPVLVLYNRHFPQQF